MHPAITISTLDLDRIDLMLDRLPLAQAAARDALSDELARADVLAPWDMPPRVVTMRSTVRFRLDGKDSEWCKTLVFRRKSARATTRSPCCRPSAAPCWAWRKATASNGRIPTAARSAWKSSRSSTSRNAPVTTTSDRRACAVMRLADDAHHETSLDGSCAMQHNASCLLYLPPRK